MDLNIKDKVIVDKGADNEDLGIILMLGEDYAGIYTEYGDRIVVHVDRLTKE